MSDGKSLNTSSVEVIISSKCERFFIRDVSDLTLQIIFDASWASMNVSLKQPIASNNSRHAASQWFHFHCGIEETGSTGIIRIVCHQVLRHPSEHGTSSMGKHLLAKVHIAKLNELTESEVTVLTSLTVDETALAILKRQGSRGIPIISVLRNMLFDIPLDPYWPKWQTKRSKMAAKDFETSGFHQDTWNRYLMSGVVLAHIPCNAISNLERQRSYMALREDLVLSSVTTLSNICWMEYALPEDAIKKQLLIWNKVSLGLDGWTSTNKWAIMSDIACNMDVNWALDKTRLALDVVDHLFRSRFES